MNSNSGKNILLLENVVLSSDNSSDSKGVSFSVERGKVHALFGDNSELLNQIFRVVAGSERAYSGTIWYDGKQCSRFNPRKATRIGIEIIDRFQKAFLNLSVIENIFSERYSGSFGFLFRRRKQKELAEDFFKRLSLNIPLFEKVYKLTEAEQKIIEIARSILAAPKLLLLEEPVLIDIQQNLKAGTIDKLFYILTIMVRGGTTILFRSNDMDRIFSFADKISIFKCDTVFETVSVNDIDKFQLINMAYEFIVSRKELEKNNFELFYYKQIYEEVIENLIFPLIVTDTNRKIIIFNSQARSGFFPDEPAAVMKSVYEVVNISESQVSEIEHSLLEFPASKIISLDDCYPQTTIYVSAVRDKYGSYMGMMYFFSGNQAFDVLDNGFLANTTKFDMEFRLNEIIHEVKNPLGIITNFLGLVKQDDSLDSIRASTLSIEKEVERITRLLNKLIGHNSSLPNDKQSMTLIPMLFDDIVSFLRPIMSEKNIELVFTKIDEKVLRYDPDLMRQVILNIMLNAVEAMPNGGKMIVESRTEQVDELSNFIIAISDNGHGIPPESIEAIFEPFYTTKHDKLSSGIGLSLCLDIVNSFNGRITVQSKVDEGTTVIIHLPD